MATLGIYAANLGRFARAIGPATPLPTVDALTIQRYLVGLRETMQAISADQHDRNLRTLFKWAVGARLLAENPMCNIPRPRTSMPLPDVPTEEELRAILAVCTKTFEGTRNNAIILTMADAALRSGEVARARVRDWDQAELSIIIRLGKGRKDRVTFVSPTTAEAINRHLAMRPGVCDPDPLFVDAQGRPLTIRHLVQILHRLSDRAGLPRDRRLHPHALRHFAATSWLRNGMGLDQVRRLLGHTSISMTLRYSSLVAADLQRAHREAAAVERMITARAPRSRPRRPRAAPCPVRTGLRRVGDGRDFDEQETVPAARAVAPWTA